MRTHSWRLVVLAATLSTVPQMAGYAAPHQASVQWSFATRADRSTTPHTAVFLLVGGRRILVLRNAEAQFSTLARRDYQTHGVPLQAAAACTGWWAGQGEDLYVIRRHGQWVVFMRALDEEAPIPAYKRLQNIPWLGSTKTNRRQTER